MKKLLSLLSVLTISGTAVPTTIAASPYQKEETTKNSDINYQQTNNLKSLIRSKRGVNHGNEIEASRDDIFASFKPDLWEEIKINYNYYSNLTDFQEWFKNRMNAGVWKDHRIRNSDLKGLAKNIWNNWSNYSNIWENSSKRQRIRIKCAWNRNFGYRYVNIRTDDSNYYPNWRLDNELNSNWNRDFNNKTNLGIIDNDKNETILNAIKNKNPNLDISQIEIANKKNYSHFSKGFSVKVKVKNGSKKYSNGIIKNDFIFNTKVNIDKINNIIKNDLNVNNWINDLKDWKKDVDNELKTSFLQKTDNEKIEWKNRKKEDLKTYIREWNYIINLIELDLKLKELNNVIQSIENDINILKQQISELNQKINTIKTNLEGDKDLGTCTKTGTLISATTGWIPIIGTLVSTISGTVAATCDIANT